MKESQFRKEAPKPVTLVTSSTVGLEQGLTERDSSESRQGMSGKPRDTMIDLGLVPDGLRNCVSQGKVLTETEGCESCARPVVILRDTRASQSLMLADVLPLSKGSALKAKALIQGVGHVGDAYTAVSLHRVTLESGLVTGIVTVGVVPTLPVEGVSFLLGNDLAGGKVSVSPMVVEEPETQLETEKLREEFPGIFPACVVTIGHKLLKLSRMSCSLSSAQTLVSLWPKLSLKI